MYEKRNTHNIAQVVLDNYKYMHATTPPLHFPKLFQHEVLYQRQHGTYARVMLAMATR